MGVKKWSKITQFSKATDLDRAEARAELARELASNADDSLGVTRIEFTIPRSNDLAPALPADT